MPRFEYRAVTAQGKRISGMLEEDSAEGVARLLEQHGLTPLRIDQKDSGDSRHSGRKKRITTQHVLEFTEQLSSLLEAGLPLDRALQVLMGTLENASMRDVVQGILLEVEKGRTLTDAFNEYPKVFPKMYVNMVKAGEEGGILPVVLKRLIEFYERSLEFRSFVITSSIYPLLLFGFGIAALVVLAVFVIPKFGEIFGDAGQQIPFAAAMLIGASNFIVKYGLVIVGALALLVGSFVYYIKTPEGRSWWHGVLLKLPLLGNLILKIQLARVTRTLGTLLSSGVLILTSISIVQGITENIPLKRALERLQQAVREGKGVARPLLADHFFPPLLGHLATVGEESGALDRMLLKVADQYDQEVRKVTKAFIALFEPAMIVFMGGLIGLIVVSMLTAIFSINDLPM